MGWIQLQRKEQLAEIVDRSVLIPQLIFKHSTRCSISSMALNRIESHGLQNSSILECYFLDLIQFRELSNLIAQNLHVIHQSPQAILLKNGKVVYNDSHGSIDNSEIEKASNS
jgi:bacillithiol system protein YtxJ